MLIDDLLPLLREEVPLEQLVAALGSLSPKERKALSRDVGDRCSFGRLGYDGTTSAALIAILGCVNGLRQVASELRWMQLEPAAVSAAVQVLRDRQPPWLPDLPGALLSDRRAGHWHWRFVRALVLEGLVERPDSPEYATGMISGLLPWLVGHGGDLRDQQSILADLLADPGLIEYEIWRMLANEGAGKQLAATDKWLEHTWRADPRSLPVVDRPARTWRYALIKLSAEGLIDRSRLLDQTLAAFLRDWAPSDLGWFIGLHDALSPTVDELAVRQGTYARLLGAEPGMPVSLAQQQFAKLLKANRLDSVTFLAASRAPLMRADKGPVVAQLKLLKDIASRDAAARPAVAALVVHALEHDRIDIRERASELLADLEPDPTRRDELLASDGRTTVAAVSTVAVGRVPATPLAPHAPLDVLPVSDANELADLFRALIEEADNPIEVERALEGVARLAREHPTYGGEVLTRRAKELLATYFPGPWSGQELRADLCALVLVWLAGASPGRGHQGRNPGPYVWRFSRDEPPVPDWTLGSLVSLRTHEVARAVAEGGAAMLALPTTTDGAISPDALSARLRHIPRTSRPWPLDLGLAALRVPPASYSDVVVPPAHRTGRLLEQQLERLHRYAPTWVRVSTPDTRYGADPYSPAVSWLDKTSVKGSTVDAVAAVLDRTDPLYRLSHEAEDGEYSPRFDQVAGLWPVFMPHHPELLAAHAHARLTRGLTKNRASTEGLLAALGRSGCRTGPVTCSALVLGLAAKNAAERTAAVDALADLARRGLLDGTELGAQAGELMKQDLVVGQRIAQGLADAARADTAATAGVLDALSALLPILPGRRDAHQFIELTAELAAKQEREIVLPAAFEQLARSGSSSVLAAACRRVPMPGK